MLWLGVVGSSIEVLFFPKVRVHKCRVGQIASAGNRTRVTSMATMYSTTRPLMLIGTLKIGARAFWLRAKSQYVVVVVVCMQLCRRGCVCVCGRASRCLRMGLLELMGCSTPRSSCGWAKQNYRRFFWLSCTSPAALPKTGFFFRHGAPFLPLFFSPSWHLPKVLILQSASA